MYQAFLIKYAEIGIKGKNRYLFENALRDQIKFVLRFVEGVFHVSKEQGRIFIETEGPFDYEGAISALQKVFGIVSICPVEISPKTDFAGLQESMKQWLKREEGEQSAVTFKVSARRADKKFPYTSPEICEKLGGYLLQLFPNWSVKMEDPDRLIQIEIRDRVYFYMKTIKGPGGMPIGTNGKAMLLLSGGIDSPVAGYQIAKRGVRLEAVYFHAPPYTSERAKQKVIDLAKIVAGYAGPIQLHIVPFTQVQLALYEECPQEQLTILMRRAMMRIAEHFAKEADCLGLVTGESIGQVASQTMHSLQATNAVCTLPVYRPLIGMDKQEIIDKAQEIQTYDTSILPYEDCCTIFVAKHPVTKPKIKNIEQSERKIEERLEQLIQQAIKETEIQKID